MLKPIVTTLVISILTSGSLLFAQENGVIEATTTNSAIIIDGVLNEESWKEAREISDFIQYEPAEGKESDHKTVVRILFGKDDLYVGALLYDTRSNIENNLGRRDEYNRADWFMVSLDSYYSGRTAFTLPSMPRESTTGNRMITKGQFREVNPLLRRT